jgi:hypothetical protein
MSPSQGRYLTQDNTSTEETQTDISVLRVGFEPTIPVFERVKTVQAVTVIYRKLALPGLKQKRTNESELLICSHFS